MMSQCKVQIVSALLSVDSMHQSCAICLPIQSPRHNGLIPPCVSVCERTASCGLTFWRPLGDPHCPRLASRVFSVLELQKTEGCWWFCLPLWQMSHAYADSHMVSQVCVQEDGEAKAPSYRAHRLTLPYQLRTGKADSLVPMHIRANHRATSHESPTDTVLPDRTPRC